MRQLLTLLLIAQMLITSVCAYAHMSADFDDPFSSPHIHIDTHSHQHDEVENDSVHDSHNSHSSHNYEHDDGDESCHVHLNLAGLSLFSFMPLNLQGARVIAINHSFSGLIHTPPVPPPTR